MRPPGALPPGRSHGLGREEGVQLLGWRWRGVGHALVRGRAWPAAAALEQDATRRRGDNVGNVAVLPEVRRARSPATPTRARAATSRSSATRAASPSSPPAAAAHALRRMRSSSRTWPRAAEVPPGSRSVDPSINTFVNAPRDELLRALGRAAPELRFIVLLREPVDRVSSSVRMTAWGWEKPARRTMNRRSRATCARCARARRRGGSAPSVARRTRRRRRAALQTTTTLGSQRIGGASPRATRSTTCARRYAAAAVAWLRALRRRNFVDRDRGDTAWTARRSTRRTPRRPADGPPRRAPWRCAARAAMAVLRPRRRSRAHPDHALPPAEAERSRGLRAIHALGRVLGGSSGTSGG